MGGSSGGNGSIYAPALRALQWYTRESPVRLEGQSCGKPAQPTWGGCKALKRRFGGKKWRSEAAGSRGRRGQFSNPVIVH